MSSNSVGASILPEMFRFGLYKARQGKLVRQATIVVLVVMFPLSTKAFLALRAVIKQTAGLHHAA